MSHEYFSIVKDNAQSDSGWKFYNYQRLVVPILLFIHVNYILNVLVYWCCWYLLFSVNEWITNKFYFKRFLFSFNFLCKYYKYRITIPKYLLHDIYIWIYMWVNKHIILNVINRKMHKYYTRFSYTNILFEMKMLNL